MRGFAYAGFLDEMRKKLCVDWGARCPALESVSGCSIGAIVALLLCLGYSSSEIMELVATLEVSALFRFDPKSILTGFTGPYTSEKHLGLDDGTSLRAYIADRIHYKFKSKISRKQAETYTLAQLFVETGIELRVITTNITLKSTVTFSNDDVAIVDAVYASAALPPFFAPIRIRNELYADGGLLAYTAPGLNFTLCATPSLVPLEERIANATSPMAHWMETVVTLATKPVNAQGAIRIDCGCTPMVQLGDLTDIKLFLIRQGRDAFTTYISSL